VPDVTREEWYSSKKFLLLRLINQMSNELKHKTQQLHDVVSLLNAEYETGLSVTDKFNLLVRQMKVVNLEIDELIGDANKLHDLLSPKISQITSSS
jgi:hypothetical protein